MTLSRALKAKTEEDRLEFLLAAWRACRHPRIAELIERVAAPLVEAGGPVKAKSVPARTQACIELAKKKTAVGLGRVLTTEWPGTWQPALPLLQAVCKAPDDPRVAAHFAAQIDATRYDTWTSAKYWRRLFARLKALKDVRQLPLLEAQLGRAKPYYYARDMRPSEERIVTAYKKLKVPKLSAANEQALTELEAPYAIARAQKRTATSTGEELLAAVYASPADHSLRLVYGDWLLQQGDPRGELISLQAGPPSDKSRARIRTLIKKHWQQWLGPVRDWLREAPDFVLGFPSTASVETSNHAAGHLLAEIVERPEWRTIEWLQQWPFFNDYPLAKALAHPHFAQVWRVSQVHDRELTGLLELAPPLTDLEVASIPDELVRLELGRLKHLKTLRLHPRLLDRVAHALDGLESIVITSARELTSAQWQLLERSGVQNLRLAQYEAGVWLRRPTKGQPFEALELGSTSLHDLGQALRLVPDTVLRFTGAPLEFNEAELLTLRAQLKHLKQLDFETLPHTVEVVAPPAKQVQHLTVSMSGAALLAESKAARVWELFARDFGVPFDQFDVGSARRELGDDPVARIKAWAKDKRQRSMYLRVAGGKAVAALHKDKASYTVLELPLADAKQFGSALRALIDFAQPDVGSVLDVKFGRAPTAAEWKRIDAALEKAGRA